MATLTAPLPGFTVESGGSTLEELILGVWEDLLASARAECPVCEGTLVPEACLDCGAQLS